MDFFFFFLRKVVPVHRACRWQWSPPVVFNVLSHFPLFLPTAGGAKHSRSVTLIRLQVRGLNARGLTRACAALL